MPFEVLFILFIYTRLFHLPIKIPHDISGLENEIMVEKLGVGRGVGGVRDGSRAGEREGETTQDETTWANRRLGETIRFLLGRCTR